jgi:short-subunit dehydrogenase
MFKRNLPHTPHVFQPQCALVTGASSGLGREFCRQLAKRGCSLILVARNLAPLTSTRKWLKRHFPDIAVEILSADLSTAEGSARVANRLSVAEGDSEHLPVDLLVNNAGFGIAEPFHRSSLAAEHELFQVLAWAPLELSHAALPQMIDRKHGAILNVASMAGALPAGSYSAAKAHTIMLSRSLATSYRQTGILVTALCPGFVRTQFHKRMGVGQSTVPWFAWAKPQRVVRDGLRALERGQSVRYADWRYRMLSPLLRVVPDGLIERFNVIKNRTKRQSKNR